jgi:hypothetical protein
MRTALVCLCVAGLLAGGCNKASTSGTTETTVTPSSKSADTGAGAGAGEIELESGPPTLERGKTTKWTISVNRKSTKTEPRFQGEIKLEFDTGAAPGVKIEPATIPAGKESVEVSVTTAADSKGGEITVIGKGQGAKPGEMMLRPIVR